MVREGKGKDVRELWTRFKEESDTPYCSKMPNSLRHCKNPYDHLSTLQEIKYPHENLEGKKKIQRAVAKVNHRNNLQDLSFLVFSLHIIHTTTYTTPL